MYQYARRRLTRSPMEAAATTTLATAAVPRALSFFLSGASSGDKKRRGPILFSVVFLSSCLGFSPINFFGEIR